MIGDQRIRVFLPYEQPFHPMPQPPNIAKQSSTLVQSHRWSGVVVVALLDGERSQIKQRLKVCGHRVVRRDQQSVKLCQVMASGWFRSHDEKGGFQQLLHRLLRVKTQLFIRCRRILQKSLHHIFILSGLFQETLCFIPGCHTAPFLL